MAQKARLVFELLTAALSQLRFTTDFHTRDANGVFRGYTDFSAVAGCGFGLNLVDLTPGGSVSGCIGFEVPESGNLELIYAPYQYASLQPGRYLSFRLR